MKKIVFIVNPCAKNATRIKELKEYLVAIDKSNAQNDPQEYAGEWSCEVRELLPNEDIFFVAKGFVRENYFAIVACGGDGTINAVAKTTMTSETLLGILPFGTLNHFAKDLKIPLSIIEAVDLILKSSKSSSNITTIDTAMCNDQFFLNNSSIGVYPRIVSFREEYQKSGRFKWVAFIIAATKVLRKIPLIKVRIQLGEQIIEKKSCFVFIGNNVYGLGGLKTGSRTSLSDGKLTLWISHTTSRTGIIHLLFRAFLGNVREHKDFDAFEATEVWVDTNLKNIQISFDGEVTRLMSPLHYKIVPRSLSVISPLDNIQT